MKRDIWFKSVCTTGSEKRKVRDGIVPLFLDFVVVMFLLVIILR